MPSRRNRILFFRQGNFSYINENVAHYLREQFPDADLIQIDVLQEVIKPSRLAVYGSALAALFTYLPRIVTGEQLFRDVYYRTPYLFHAVRKLIAGKYHSLAARSLFSIQTQSLYDASIDGLPHFLYTDHTHLANLKYPGFTRSQLYSPGWIKLESSAYHRARLNLVMNGFVRDSLVNDYQCDPSSIAIVGAAPNVLPPDTIPDNAGYSNRTILFVGIDWERKGGPILLEAFRIVREALPDARLIIAGASPVVDIPNVQVLGRLPPSQISELLQRGSVLALPSWREPQAINAIEALAHGIPVVATNVGGVPEAVENGVSGRIIPVGDVQALASALIELLSNPALCRRYGEAARETSLARRSPAVVSRRFGDAIRSSLGQPAMHEP